MPTAVINRVQLGDLKALGPDRAGWGRCAPDCPSVYRVVTIWGHDHMQPVLLHGLELVNTAAAAAVLVPLLA